MSEDKRQTALRELKEALDAVPDKYHADVSKTLTHDIGVIARTIDMVNRSNSEGAAAMAGLKSNAEAARES